jgi:homeobox protein cut-like
VSALFPPTSSGNNGEEMSSSLSPLQRMASITNALVTQPHLPAHAAGLQPRPHRAVLPPITQQQFDKFQHLNTDELVRKVRQEPVNSC